MRLTAILLICLPVACAGGLYNLRNRKRALALKRFSLFFGALEKRANVGETTLRELISAGAGAAFGNGALGAALLLNAGRLPLKKAWEAAVRESADATLLTDEELRTLLRFGDALCRPGLSLFSQACRACERTFADAYERAAQKCRGVEKLSAAGALSAAALLFILLV